MSLDLLAYAAQKRYRVRNLHDGRPLHPLRVPVTKRGRSAGYVGDEDRMDAIICRRGYVCSDGDGQVGWYLFARCAKGINRWLPQLVATGGTARQLGDCEVSGVAPAEQIDQILAVLRPYRRARR
jgi:hypothetical protein